MGLHDALPAEEQRQKRFEAGPLRPGVVAGCPVAHFLGGGFRSDLATGRCFFIPTDRLTVDRLASVVP